MPKPNYAFAKRQRELAKKQKAEEKRQRKAAGLPPLPDEPESAEDGLEASAANPDDGAPESSTGGPAGQSGSASA